MTRTWFEVRREGESVAVFQFAAEDFLPGEVTYSDALAAAKASAMKAGGRVFLLREMAL
jgi:hypothetical protein